MNDCIGQLILGFTPGYHKGEKTSKAADDSIKELKASQCQQIFMVIRNHINGGTSQEIAAKGNIPNEIIHKRLSTLRDNGYLREGNIRKCKITGRMAKTWWIV